jgi:xanthine dehydrogenase small subunit
MASAQIRNVATLAGNVANASPVADGAVLLLALGATVTTAALDGTRELPLDEFFTGHRKTALRAGEILVRLLVPAGPVRTSFIKTGKRSAVDIASVNSALALKCDGTHISTGRLALGGVAPTPILAAKAGALLSGVTASWSLAVAVADAAAAEVTPIADVRGSAEFRRTLVRNQVLAHFLRLFPELAEAH